VNRTEPMPADADVRETPPELFAELNARFNFTLDACASHTNAKCATYFTEDGMYVLDCGPELDIRKLAPQDGLAGSWEGARVWANVPFSDIAPWVIKAWESKAELVYMLVPATRTEQGWFQDLIEPFRDGRDPFPGSDLKLTTHFMRSRVHFLKNGKRIVCEKVGSKHFGKPSSAKFGCVGLVWSRK
jgi:phage N-6-adenine-methyltransferase